MFTKEYWIENAESSMLLSSYIRPWMADRLPLKKPVPMEMTMTIRFTMAALVAFQPIR